MGSRGGIKLYLNKNINYNVTINFVPIPGDNNTRLVMNSKDLKSLTNYTQSLDKRTHTVALNPSLDLDCYFNYMNYISDIARNIFANSDVNNNFTKRLDSGYLPLVLLPSFMNEEVTKPLIQTFASRGFNILRFRAMRLDGDYLESGYDYWISKLEVFDIMKIHPLDVTTIKVLEKLVGG